LKAPPTFKPITKAENVRKYTKGQEILIIMGKKKYLTGKRGKYTARKQRYE
jgi:hypothetical protein